MIRTATSGESCGVDRAQHEREAGAVQDVEQRAQAAGDVGRVGAAVGDVGERDGSRRRRRHAVDPGVEAGEPLVLGPGRRSFLVAVDREVVAAARRKNAILSGIVVPPSIWV